MDWKNHLEKNPIQKIEKTVKSEIAHVNKPLARKRIFVQTRFSHPTFNFTPQNYSIFCFNSCFDVTKITIPIDFRNHENARTDL